MKKLKTSVALAALAAIILAVPAVAADIEAPAPEAVNWTAFHVGVGGGGTYGFADESSEAYFHDHNQIEDLNGIFVEGESSSDLGDAGFFGTVEAGFDYQLGSSVVIGALANYDFGKTKMNHEHGEFVNDNNGNILDDATYKTEWEIGDSWGIGGRLGFLVHESALVYALGGYTQAKIKGEVDLQAANNSEVGTSHSDSSWEDGWFVGGGVEALLTENISLKGEYRYADYGSVKIDSDDFDDTSGMIHDGSSQEADITVHSVRAVLSYRFGL